VASWLVRAEYVVALTGAGISTESGIPDFRGPSGIWTKDPAAEKLFTLQNYVAERDVRIRSWRSRLEHPAWVAKPNAGHEALVELERRGLLHTLITQNVDGLHLAAGTSPDILIEIHGSMREAVCLSCGVRIPMERALERVRGGDDDPECRRCGGILKSATISFGQALDERDVLRAQAAAQQADVFLAIGTSLQVYPAAYLPEIAVRHGAKLVIVNAQETPYDEAADAVFREPIGDVLPAIVESLDSFPAAPHPEDEPA
jgi:NAD-dependent deacetylase